MGFLRLFLALALSLAGGQAVAIHGGLEFLEEPAEAPVFELPDLEGRLHRLEDYRGNHLIVTFWASWCSPCIREMPALERAFQALRGDRIAVLAINVGETRKWVERFDEESRYQFTLLLDEGMSTSNAWQVKGMPTSFIVDPDGAVVARVTGVYQWDSSEFIDRLRRMNAR